MKKKRKDRTKKRWKKWMNVPKPQLQSYTTCGCHKVPSAAHFNVVNWVWWVSFTLFTVSTCLWTCKYTPCPFVNNNSNHTTKNTTEITFVWIMQSKNLIPTLKLCKTLNASLIFCTLFKHEILWRLSSDAGSKRRDLDHWYLVEMIRQLDVKQCDQL